MDIIDGRVERCGIFEKQLIEFLKRFIDDILLFWAGTVQKFKEFMVRINNLHPTIKFTCDYNLVAGGKKPLALFSTDLDNV